MDYSAFERLFGEPVTSSVTGSPQRASDVPASMEIITADDIRRSGASDIPGVLRHVAGLDVLQWGNADADVGVRGYDQALSPRLLVLIDGRQVYADFYGYTPWNALPVELGAIRQIEVVKGPNTALFGFNAVDGVINIVTRNPQYEQTRELSVTGGTQDLAQGSAVGSFRLGPGAIRLSAGGRSDSDFGSAIPALMGPGPRGHDSRAAFDFDGRVRLDQGVELGLQASHVDAALNEVNPYYELADSRYHSNSLRGELSADTRWGLLGASAYTNWISLDSQASLNHIDVNLHNRVTVVQLQDVFKLGSAHTLRASAEYRYNTDDTAPIGGARVFYSVYAFGGMWEWRITPALTFTNAARYDVLQLGRSGAVPPGYPFGNADWNRGIEAPSFNSGLVWRAGAADTLRVIAASGVQAPSLVESGALLLQSTQFNVSGVPTLQPSRVYNGEAHWSHALPAIAGELRAGVFGQETDNVNAVGGGTLNQGGQFYFVPEGVGDSTAWGLELGIKGALPYRWRWSLDYRAERIRDHFDPDTQGGAGGVDYQHTAPVQLIKASLGWSGGSWEADGFLHFQTHTMGLLPGPGGTGNVLAPVPAYAALDGRVGYKLGHGLTLALSGQNLLQARQTQTSGPAAERRVLGSLSFDFGEQAR